MRRTLAGVLALLLALSLCGCGGEKKAAPALLFRYADNQPENYPTTKAAEYFARLVEERTGGEVVIRVFSDGVLGDERSVFRQMQFGGIDFARVSISTLGQAVPETEILQLPYLFRDSAHMLSVLDGEIGDMLLADIRTADVIGLSWFDAGARNLYTRSPVRTLADLEGLSIRVQESDTMSRMVALLGAKPVQLPYNEVYSALQTGLIDGAENNWPSYEATGHYEAAPCYLLDGHTRLPEVMLVSLVAMEKLRALDPSYEALAVECAQEAAEYERELWAEREIASEAALRELGVVASVPSEEALREFREAIEPMYEGFPPEQQALIELIRNS